MITIRFSGRQPSPRQTQIGMETDQRADTLRFLLPQVTDEQCAQLMLILPDGTADELQIREGMAALPARILEIPGRSRAWVEILGLNDTVAWNSEIFYLDIGDLPPISERTEQQYPTAIQEALAACVKAEGYYQASLQAASIILASTGLMAITEENGALVIDKGLLTSPNGYRIAVKNGFTGTEEEWLAEVDLVAGHASSVNKCTQTAALAKEKADAAMEAAQHAQASADAAQTQLDGLAKKETLTVPAASWQGTIAPFTATVNCQIAEADNVLIVGTGGDLTKAQYKALSSARILCTGQQQGKITLKAYGIKPEEAITVNVLGVDI